MTDSWTMIRAIGTIVTAIIAVALTAGSIISKWWNRPKLKLEYVEEKNIL